MSCPRLDEEAAAAGLAGGCVLLLATDTICGLHARADQGAALERMHALKGRHPGQPFLLLASSLDQALSLCSPVAAGVRALCEAAWPGPFTFILPAADGLHDLVRDGARGTVAVRVPRRDDLRQLIRRAGGPLASTSANRTGEAPLADLDAAVAAFGPLVDGCWGGGGVPGGGAPGAPSALVDQTVAPPRVLRPGPLPLPDLA
jgi:L-threonylcarbamoyladenylate synthase